MKKWVALILFFSQFASARESIDGGVDIANGRRLYVQHFPASPGEPTVYLLNGLTYTTVQYTSLIKALLDTHPGIGIVAYDMTDMGQTLLARLPGFDEAPLANQVEDLHLLRQKLKTEGPTFLYSLSYGGAVGIMHSMKYPDDFSAYILATPYIENIKKVEDFIKQMHDQISMTFPMWSDAAITDYIIHMIAYTYTAQAEPNINLFWPNLIEGVYRLIKGSMDWNAFVVSDQLPKGRVHLIGAFNDDVVGLDRTDAFWQKIRKQSGVSYLRMHDTGHKVSEDWPVAIAHWIDQIVQGNLALGQGFVFEGYPKQNMAMSGDIMIGLGPDKGTQCENKLRIASKPRRKALPFYPW